MTLYDGHSTLRQMPSCARDIASDGGTPKYASYRAGSIVLRRYAIQESHIRQQLARCSCKPGVLQFQAATKSTRPEPRILRQEATRPMKQAKGRFGTSQPEGYQECAYGHAPISVSLTGGEAQRSR